MALSDPRSLSSPPPDGAVPDPAHSPPRRWGRCAALSVRGKMAGQAVGRELGLKYSRALNLSEVESKRDPESEPYRSKYAARELLKELKAAVGQRAQPGEVDDEPALDAEWLQKAAVLELQLGLNHTETEELSAGEEHLAKCVEILETLKFRPEAVSVFIQAQVRSWSPGNRLGRQPTLRNILLLDGERPEYPAAGIRNIPENQENPRESETRKQEQRFQSQFVELSVDSERQSDSTWGDEVVFVQFG